MTEYEQVVLTWWKLPTESPPLDHTLQFTSVEAALKHAQRLQAEGHRVQIKRRTMAWSEWEPVLV